MIFLLFYVVNVTHIISLIFMNCFFLLGHVHQQGLHSEGVQGVSRQRQHVLYRHGQVYETHQIKHTAHNFYIVLIEEVLWIRNHSIRIRILSFKPGPLNNWPI
jgi:hypothetical protein